MRGRGVRLGPVALALGMLLSVLAVPPVASDGSSLSGWTIVVDPGHGGDDPGATGFGLEEADVVLDIGKRLRDLLEAEGATVLMTRETDETVSLTDRTDLANDNDADRFVSIHANACGDCGARGTETYYHDSLDETSDAADLADKAQTEMVDHLGTTDRGVKQANFHVLRETEMPAILAETAFIDQEDDNAILDDPDKRQEFARALLHAVQSHLGVTPHDPDGDVTPPLITVTAPDLDQWQTADVTVEATIEDESGIQWARARIDDGDWQWDTPVPHEWTWDTAEFDDGERDLNIQSRDNAGNLADDLFTLKVDNTPPEVEITQPGDGAIILLGVTVKADADDAASGVDRVEFLVDGELRAVDNEAPYQWHWDALFEIGFHDVTARAFDRVGLSAQDTHDVLVI